MAIKRLISLLLLFIIICSCIDCITEEEYLKETGSSGINEPDITIVDQIERHNTTLKKSAILDLENGYSLKILDIDRKEDFTVISFRKDGNEYSKGLLFTGQTHNVKDPVGENVVYSIRLDKIYDSSFSIDLTYELRAWIFPETEPISIEPGTKAAVTLTDDSITRIYKWEYNNTEFWIKAEYNREDYELYSGRGRNRDYVNFATDPYDDELISQITTQLEYMAAESGYGSVDMPYIATAFVQSIPYVYDNDSTGYDEYPKFPFETLYHYGGDCEDLSILLTAILHDMGYGAALIAFPGHVAAGVQEDESMSGINYDYNGVKYFYIESTNPRRDIGEMRARYRNATARITPIDNVYPYLDIDFSRSSQRQTVFTYVDLEIEITNDGLATAEDVKIYAYLEPANEGKYLDQITIIPHIIWEELIRITTNIDISRGGPNGGIGWDRFQSDVIPKIEADRRITYTVSNLKVPVGQEYRVIVRAWGSNVEEVTVYGDWFIA